VISPREQDADWARRRDDDAVELPSHTAASKRRAMQAAMTAAVLAMRSSGRRRLPRGGPGGQRQSGV
jgi:hypothetical protein